MPNFTQIFIQRRQMKNNIVIFLGVLICAYAMVTFNSGCAQIGFPTGGARDTLAPRLLRSVPAIRTTNFTGNKISFTFDEYIDIQELQSNLIISPLQKKSPTVSFNLKTVTIKFKDTLLPNTTYSIDFGDAIKDLNEGNVHKNFTYTFSTGNTIDSLKQSGKVILAETGNADSTLMVMLYRNGNDSSVLKRKPDYIARIKGDGSFVFNNLPPALFKIYALKDGDAGKTYNSKTEVFAFADKDINTEDSVQQVVLYAYAEQKDDKTKTPAIKTLPEKKLKYSTTLLFKTQDLLIPFEVTFNNPLKTFEKEKIIFSDTNYKPVANAELLIDSTRKKISIKNKWLPETKYLFILPKDGIADSSGNVLLKTDTISFVTKRTDEYGRVLLRFKNLDLSKHPVIQFVQSDIVKYSYAITGSEWSNDLFSPGEYEVRILYDDNGNGIWDPGNYSKKLQPEKAITLPTKIAIKADWDNERDITL